MPMKASRRNASLRIGTESLVTFTLRSNNEINTNFGNALFRDPGDPLRFSYSADQPLAAEFEGQMTALIRGYEGDREYPSRHHPDEQGANDDAPDSTALMLHAPAAGGISDTLF